MELIKQNTQSQIIKNIIIVFLGSILLAISAKIKIPFYLLPVPMTMQTFVVLFLGIGFGYKIGSATVILYLMEGIFGFPVFSNSPEKGVGIIYFTGPTMGYLIGFILAVFLIGYLKLDDWTKKGMDSIKFFFMNFIKLLVSVSSIYLLGLLWLSNLIGFEKALLFGLKPFWAAELFKIVLLAFLIPFILKLRKFI
jgi:biotin transport system substrate-specific component